MMEEKQSKKLSFAERLKQQSKKSEKYGGVAKEEKASMQAKDCPNCGAGRAKHEGVTHCAYCGFEFITEKMTQGIHLNESDNSQTLP